MCCSPQPCCAKSCAPGNSYIKRTRIILRFERILIVDDDERWRRAYKRTLEACGYVVALAADYETALENLELYLYPVVVVDMRLLGHWDTEGLRLIKEIDRLEASDSIHKIIISGYPLNPTEIEKFTQIIGRGSVSFLSKEGGPGRLIDELERISSQAHYNIATIRNLISDAFTDKELLRFCQDRSTFQPVLADFGANASLNDMTDVLIVYCQKRLLLRELLEEIRGYNSAQYDRYQSELYNAQTTSTNMTGLHDERKMDNHMVTSAETLGGTIMDWQSIVQSAVSAITPYVTIVATGAASTAGPQLGAAFVDGTKKLFHWFEEKIKNSRDEDAQQTWDDFKQNPQNDKYALVDAILRLNPEEDAALRGHLEGLTQEVLNRKGKAIFTLLDNRRYFTFEDLERICSRINVYWEDEIGSNPSRQKMARWVVRYVPTRMMEGDLVAAMLEVNPVVVLQ